MKKLIVVLTLLIWSAPAAAIDVTVEPGYMKREIPVNVAGGFDYLPDGDGIGIERSFGQPRLYRFDLNGDGSPAIPEILFTLEFGAFGSFVRVSPNGKFALFGTSVPDLIRRIDLQTGAISTVITLVNNYDAAFLTEAIVYVSANGDDKSSLPSNRIYGIPLSNPNLMKVVVSINDTPSGPITFNNFGDLYYAMSTEVFPAPANSHHLLKFSSAAIANAFASGVPLTLANTELNIIANSGFNIAFDKADGFPYDLFMTEIGGRLLGISENDSALMPIALNNHLDSGQEGFTFMAAHGNKVGLSVATDFFSTFSLVEIENPSAPPGGTPGGSADLCPADENKIEAGVCGCGIPDTDADLDGVLDCEDVCPTLSASVECLRPTWTHTKPRKPKLKSKKGKLTIDLQKLEGAHYEVVVKALAKGKKKWKTSTLTSDVNLFQTKKFKRGAKVRIKYRLFTTTPYRFDSPLSSQREHKIS